MPALTLGSYKFTLTPQSEPACAIENGPSLHPEFGPLPGIITFTAKFRIKVEQVDKSQILPSWMPASSWELGFYQVVESAKRRVYKRVSRATEVERTGVQRAFRGVLGLDTTRSSTILQFQKTRIVLPEPYRDGPSSEAGEDNNRPWYESSASIRWELRLLGRHERMVDLEIRDAPGVVIKNDPLICGLKQEQMHFSTYVLFMDQQRRHGWTLRHWKWSADFAYYKDPQTLIEELKGPGIVLVEEDKKVSVNSRGLPDNSPPDTPVAKDALEDLQHSVEPSFVNNAYYDMALDMPWQ